MHDAAADQLVGALTPLLRALVDVPEAVHLEMVQGTGLVNVDITVAQEDVGKVIGNQGRMAESLRTIARAIGGKHGFRATLNIQEP